MEWGAALAHWMHIMAAIVWVGGTLVTALVVQPALRQTLGEAERMAVYAAMGRRLTLVQWAAWSVLLATGLYKLWGLRESPGIFLTRFGLILGLKLLLVAAMVVLSLLHARAWGPMLAQGRLEPRQRAELARRAAFWGRVNAALMAGIVFCAVLLRYGWF